jgi:DNA-binding transcriptional MerR regulator
MPTEFTLNELAKLADVTPRTIRYYIAQGLLPSPTAAGTAARYSEDHLDRLRAIKRLQSAHMPLAEIRALLRRGEYALQSVADAMRSEPTNSAADYISEVLNQYTHARRAPTTAPSAAPPQASMPLPNLPAPASASEPNRGTWERIALHPDIELHVRRPLGRLQNKRVERLISIARQLLEEE